MRWAVFYFGLVALVLANQGCRIGGDQYGGCSADQLLIDSKAFPREVDAGELITPLPEGPINSVGQTFYLGRGIANHDIYPFSTVRRAADEFRHYQKDPAFSQPMGGPWQLPEELTTLVLNADQYDLACGEQHNIHMCKLIARYDNYFTYFNVHLYPNELSLLDVKSLILEIDRRMVDCSTKRSVGSE